MNTPLLSDELVSRDGAANLQRGWETVGGWLYLTNRRLIFESHGFNVRAGATIISYDEIRDVQACWTRLFNLFPIAPNSIAVSTHTGTTYRIAVYGRSAWRTAIEVAKGSFDGASQDAVV